MQSVQYCKRSLKLFLFECFVYFAAYTEMYTVLVWHLMPTAFDPAQTSANFLLFVDYERCAALYCSLLHDLLGKYTIICISFYISSCSHRIDFVETVRYKVLFLYGRSRTLFLTYMLPAVSKRERHMQFVRIVFLLFMCVWFSVCCGVHILSFTNALCVQFL